MTAPPSKKPTTRPAGTVQGLVLFEAGKSKQHVTCNSARHGSGEVIPESRRLAILDLGQARTGLYATLFLHGDLEQGKHQLADSLAGAVAGFGRHDPMPLLVDLALL